MPIAEWWNEDLTAAVIWGDEGETFGRIELLLHGSVSNLVSFEVTSRAVCALLAGSRAAGRPPSKKTPLERRKARCRNSAGASTIANFNYNH
ncbi:hypothetical protein SGFS_017130 [Streptomyces graminofaciens]|uniref:Uncharacterized protein n=1 Tax=Streptomyces graminofaciens TaxID=68212 RepID=A0ABM7F3K4_9ACTN|nr:hypothetical protein SGFS_017130 [Streptomyces graminofaciens]